MEKKENLVAAIIDALSLILNVVTDVMSQILLTISGIMIMVMAFAATYGVTRRYFLQNPEPYSYEISKILLIWCFVLAVAALQKQERHLRGDFILNHLPRNFRFFINHILSPMLAVLCSAILVWKGWEASLFSFHIWERSVSAWKEPLFPVKVMIPIGYSFLFIVAATQLFLGIITLVKKCCEYGETEELKKGDRI